MSKQVYISGALTNANRKQFYEEIAEVVNSLGYKAYVPHMYTDPEKNPDATPKEVYERDMKEIENSCLVIAYVGIPSFGVGIELERASSKGIPIILLHHNDDKVSRMALGIPGANQYSITFYDEEWALKKLKKAIAEKILKNEP